MPATCSSKSLNGRRVARTWLPCTSSSSPLLPPPPCPVLSLRHCGRAPESSPCPPPLPQRSPIPHSPSSLSALSLCPPWTGRHGGHHWWVKPSLAKLGCPVGLFGCGSALGDLLGLPHCPSASPCRSLSRPSPQSPLFWSSRERRGISG